MTAKNQDCDNCRMHTEKSGKIKWLNLGNDSGAYLCEKCWNKEMRNRREMNKTLFGAPKFSVRKFPK